jgi:UPF0716 family protein affecting phage T7 exclusion
MANISSTALAGTSGTLIIIGAILFLFPEPVTSGAGVFLLLAGILVWLLE